MALNKRSGASNAETKRQPSVAVSVRLEKPPDGVVECGSSGVQFSETTGLDQGLHIYV